MIGKIKKITKIEASVTSPETEVEKDSIFTFIKLLCSMVVRAINKQDQRPKAGLQHQIKMNTFEKQIY